jgi:hypothetical protein
MDRLNVSMRNPVWIVVDVAREKPASSPLSAGPFSLETILRWIARAWGLASTLLLFAFAFGGHEHLRLTMGEAAVFLFFPVGVVAGMLVAWRYELAGGLIAVGSLAVFYLCISTWGGGISPGPYFLLFAAPGFLHLALALLSSSKRKTSLNAIC